MLARVTLRAGLGQRLWQERLSRGRSQADLARAAGTETTPTQDRLIEILDLRRWAPRT